jgi:hypothetical protein
MLRWTADLALGVIGVVWVLLYHEFGLVSIHLYIATALGLGLMIRGADGAGVCLAQQRP